MKPVVGSGLTSFRIASVSPEGMKAWAKFLHDPNPIHLDPAVVRAKGLGERVINQGPCNLAYIISMLQAALPGSLLDSLDIRYVDNVYGGDAVEAGGKITEVTPHPGGNACVCEVWLRAEGRGPVITGTAVVRVPDRETI
jgi:3-hydroxybutyryl-CoA dehydratase